MIVSPATEAKRNNRLACPKYRAKRINTEPRSGGILLAIGVSRWSPARYDQPHSGDSLKLSRLRRLSFEGLFSTGSRRWLSKCRRSAALKCMRLRFISLYWTSIVTDRACKPATAASQTGTSDIDCRRNYHVEEELS
jgi:hypothetical protein